VFAFEGVFVLVGAGAIEVGLLMRDVLPVVKPPFKLAAEVDADTEVGPTPGLEPEPLRLGLPLMLETDGAAPEEAEPGAVPSGPLRRHDVLPDNIMMD